VARRAGLDFNNAGPQSSTIDYDEVIKSGAPEGERSELFQAVVWHLAGKGWTAEQITNELARHPNGIGAKYANRLPAEVERSFDKWCTRKRATVTGSAGSAEIGDPWPQIYVIAGEIPRVVNEAEDALLLLSREIYQRGGLVVRPVLSKLKAADDRDTQSWRLVPITRPYLVETLTRAARFLKFDARSRAFVATDAPDKVADAYLARVGDWRLPVLTGIVNTPFLRADGSLCETPGYDSASGLLFKPERASFPPIPQSPTRAQAQAALDTIDALIETLPFVTPTDRSVALSAIFTTLDRRNMATAPMHALTAPSAGTGKTLLVDAIAVLATGRPMPVIAQGRTEEELEKRLAAALLAGDAAISIDNCEHALQSSFLCQALTQQHLNIRLLGLSKVVETPVNASIFATGNNLTIVGDLTRRTLLCSLDAQCERPELRTFDRDLLETVRSDRSNLVAAALTVLRGWHVANERVGLPPFGSFETWSHRVRQALVWLGRADPCETAAKVRGGDPHRINLNAVLVQWHENLGSGTYTVQQVIGRALVAADFQAALCVVAGNRAGNFVNNDRLGRWLKKVEGQIMNGLALVRAGNHHGYPLWQVNVV
jgi:putative DNA primase/helicase